MDKFDYGNTVFDTRSRKWGGYDCDKIVKSQPWFLDYVEDYFDCTYVDIYAKIKTPD